MDRKHILVPMLDIFEACLLLRHWSASLTEGFREREFDDDYGAHALDKSSLDSCVTDVIALLAGGLTEDENREFADYCKSELHIEFEGGTAFVITAKDAEKGVMYLPIKKEQLYAMLAELLSYDIASDIDPNYITRDKEAHAHIRALLSGMSRFERVHEALVSLMRSTRGVPAMFEVYRRSWETPDVSIWRES